MTPGTPSNSDASDMGVAVGTGVAVDVGAGVGVGVGVETGAGVLVAVEAVASAGVAVVVGAGVADEHAASNRSIRDNRDANGMQCFLNGKVAPFCFGILIGSRPDAYSL